MALMRGALKHTVAKLVASQTFTSTTTMTAYPVNLDDATATGQKYTWCKIIFSAEKTGTTALASVVLTPLTGTSVTCATGMTNYPALAAGTDNGHGYVAASGTVETGRFTAVYDIDLTNSQVRTWLGCTAAVTCTSTDSCDCHLMFLFGGARELPISNVGTMETTL